MPLQMRHTGEGTEVMRALAEDLAEGFEDLVEGSCGMRAEPPKAGAGAKTLDLAFSHSLKSMRFD